MRRDFVVMISIFSMPRCLGSESPSGLLTGLCVIGVFLVSDRGFVFGFCSWMLFDLSIISGFVEWTCLVRECDAHGQVDLWDSPDVAMSAVTMTSCSSRWKASLKSGADEVWNIFNTVLAKSRGTCDLVRVEEHLRTQCVDLIRWCLMKHIRDEFMASRTR